MRWGTVPGAPSWRGLPLARSPSAFWQISCRCRGPRCHKHLKVLKDAGLVVESVAGTRRLYRIEKSGLRVVREYFDRFWESALDNFAILAEAEALDDARKRGANAHRVKKG